MIEYDQTIAAYQHNARELIARYDALGEGRVYSEIHALIPKTGLALDVGAGSGRDARWLRSLGLEVVAVEPTSGFRNHGSTFNDGIRWLDDRLPSLDRVHQLGLSFDLIIMSAVWQHVAPGDRPRAFRKLVTLLRSGGVLALTLRSGRAPADRPMHPTSAGEIEALARSHGMEILKVQPSDDLQRRADVTWTTVALRMPDDGTGALPLVRGIVLGDDKSSTYKLGLLRSLARIAEHAPAAASASTVEDVVEIPLGLIALFWIRMYLPLVRLGLPQAPRNSGPDGLSFAKAGFRRLLADRIDAADLRIGGSFVEQRAAAVSAAISEAAATIAKMPANFTRFPNSDRRIFEVTRCRAHTGAGLALDLPTLSCWGLLTVPGHLWRALSRYGVWIEPMLVSEWARLTRSYGDRMELPVAPGAAEASLEWREPMRTTATARLVAERMAAHGQDLVCVWTGRKLSRVSLDIDHCLPWSAWPCGDLWNLAPCDRVVNQHQKRHRLPSALAFAESKDRMIEWWEQGYLADEALSARFSREVMAALPALGGASAAEVFDAMAWRRLRLAQDQRVPEWTR